MTETLLFLVIVVGTPLLISLMDLEPTIFNNTPGKDWYEWKERQERKRKR